MLHLVFRVANCKMQDIFPQLRGLWFVTDNNALDQNLFSVKSFAAKKILMAVK